MGKNKNQFIRDCCEAMGLPFDSEQPHYKELESLTIEELILKKNEYRKRVNKAPTEDPDEVNTRFCYTSRWA